MLPVLDTDVCPAQLVRHGCSSTGSEEGIEDKITRLRSNFQHSPNKSLGFRRIEYAPVRKELQELLLGLVIRSYVTG